jgi:hypothetical protein
MTGQPADAVAWAAAIREADPRLRARPGTAQGRWRDPADIARDQVAESKAARAAVRKAAAEAAAAVPAPRPDSNPADPAAEGDTDTGSR